MRKPKPSGRSWTRSLGVAPCLLSLTKIDRECRGVSWQSSATARVTGPRVIESGIQMKVSLSSSFQKIHQPKNSDLRLAPFNHEIITMSCLRGFHNEIKDQTTLTFVLFNGNEKIFVARMMSQLISSTQLESLSFVLIVIGKDMRNGELGKAHPLTSALINILAENGKLLHFVN